MNDQQPSSYPAGYKLVTNGTATPPPPPAEGEDMYRADEQFANVFWQRVNGEWHQMFCPAGLVFNETDQRCDVPEVLNPSMPLILNDPNQKISIAGS
ncbi:MAG TPA: carbohydrate-binding module family 14 protein [Candidatus Angelobacter sp.]|nr:carbohydrate-binding module family 14 protein [Candidatus Angelobacter sp.]